MALNANKVEFAGGGVRIVQANLEPGNYPARLVQVLDLGLQPQRAFKGDPKPPMQEIGLTYELVDTFMKDENGDDIEDKPRWVSEQIPLHNLKADLAKSTKRYNALDPSGEADGDFTRLLGTPCLVTIVNNPGKDGKIYDNIGAIGPMRKKDADKCPELVNPAVFFDLDAPDMEVFRKLPKWLQEKIQGNLNFNGSALQKALEGGVAAPKGVAKGKPEKAAPEAPDVDGPPFDTDDDNNPY